MRISKMKKERGSLIIMMMAALPLMVVMLMLVIDMGRIYVARARLDAAADRAAYAGAAVFTHALDEIAKSNWRIHKAWRDLSRDFKADSQQTDEAARQRHAEYEEDKYRSFSEIKSIQDGVGPRAWAIARETLLSNAPHASMEAFIRDETFLSDDIDPEEQGDNPHYDRIEGQNFIDPVSYKGGSFPALKFLIKRASRGPRIGVIVHQEIRPMLLGRIIKKQITIASSSTASSFGGSIEAFARKETDTIADAELKMREDGVDDLYHTAIVPMWTLDEVGEDMRH